MLDDIRHAVRVCDKDPSFQAQIDQAAAVLRDKLDFFGVQISEPHQLNSLIAMTMLFHAQTGYQFEDEYIALILSLGRFL